jgi:cold shock CspA family protein
MRQQGTIVRLIDEKKFGFIRMSDGKEVFFHMSDCLSDSPFEILDKGAVVTFELNLTAPKGPRASEVALA